MPFSKFLYIMLITLGLWIVAPNNICYDYAYILYIISKKYSS